jgi:hypothetical protein
MNLYSAALFALVSSFAQANAAVLNFRNLPVGDSTYTLSVEGILVRLGGGLLVSDTCCFGIDSAGAGDIPNLIDGGSGRAEILGLLFDQDVYVDNILISFFGPNDSGTVSIKGSGPAVALHNGANNLGGVIAARSSANFITWTGRNVSDPDLGFSIDSITVRTLPEPSCLIFTAIGTSLILLRRRVSHSTGSRSSRTMRPNKSLILRPDPPRVQAAMTVQPST